MPATHKPTSPRLAKSEPAFIGSCATHKKKNEFGCVKRQIFFRLFFFKITENTFKKYSNIWHMHLFSILYALFLAVIHDKLHILYIFKVSYFIYIYMQYKYKFCIIKKTAAKLAKNKQINKKTCNDIYWIQFDQNQTFLKCQHLDSSNQLHIPHITNIIPL